MFRKVPITANQVAALCTTKWIFIALTVFVPGVGTQWLSYDAVIKRLSDRCEYGEFDCALGDECIPLSKFRNGHIDCLDGSDEYCFPGQIKCGLHCIELAHFGECILNPQCDKSTTLPSYCRFLKTKLCQLDNALPCKGYGECVLRKWLGDGHYDCFDGSDEDPEYAKLLTSRLYPENSQKLSDGFIEVPEPENKHLPPTRNLFHTTLSPIPTSFNPYQPLLGSNLPNTPSIPAMVPPWQTPNIFDNGIGLKKTFPPFETFSTSPTFIHPITVFNNEILPINSESSSLSNPLQNAEKANFLQTSATSIPSTINPGLLGPVFAELGVTKNMSGFFQPEKLNPITLIDDQQRPASPYTDTSSGETSSTDASTWVEIDNNANKESLFSETSTRDPEKITWSPYRIVNTHLFGESEVHSLPTKPKDGPDDSKPEQSNLTGDRVSNNRNNEDWIVEHQTPVSLITSISPYTSTIPQNTKLSSSTKDIFVEISFESLQQSTPSTFTMHYSTSRATEVAKNKSVISHTISSYNSSNSSFTVQTTQVASTNSTMPSSIKTSTIKEESELKTTQKSSLGSSHMTELSVSDPNLFPYGIDKGLTTSAPDPLLNCTEKFKQMASELVPTPMCDCPSGQMRDLRGKCIVAKISMFRARLMLLCGANVRNINNEPQILTWKLASTFNYPLCVRKADDLVIFNTVCDDCEFTDLVETYAMNNDLAEIDIKLSELKDSGCYNSLLNDCDEKAECVSQGLRYKCICLPGTVDTVDGSGRYCDGTVIRNPCTQLFGVCILFWILLLLFFLILCCLVLYISYKYCKNHIINIFRKKTVNKKSTKTTSKFEQKANVELGISVDDINQDQSKNKGANVVFSTLSTSTTTTPQTLSVTKLQSVDEYSIIENDENENKNDEKDEVASVTPSHESIVIIDKTPEPASRMSTPDTSAVCKASLDSRSLTPTIWESYKKLGNQYIQFNSAKQRRSTSHSLEMLMYQKHKNEVKKRQTTMINIPNVGIVDSSTVALPPLTTVSLTASSMITPITPLKNKKQLERQSSRTSNSSTKSKVSEKTAELTKILEGSSFVPEQQVQVLAKTTATEVVEIIKPQVETCHSFEKFVLSTPDIVNAGDNAVTEELKNINISHNDDKISPETTTWITEVQVNNGQMQTSTVATPRTQNEKEVSFAELEPSKQPKPKSTAVHECRPTSGISQKSLTILLTPAIENNTIEIAGNLDKVAVALSQLPPVLPLPTKDNKAASGTHPSSPKYATNTKQSKTSCFLSREYERSSTAVASGNRRLTTNAKLQIPVIKQEKFKPRISDPWLNTTIIQQKPHQNTASTKHRKINDAPDEKKAAPMTKHRTGSIPRLLPIPKPINISSIKTKKSSTSKPSTNRPPLSIKTLPKIELTPTTSRKVTKKSPPTKLPPLDIKTPETAVLKLVSTPNTIRESTGVMPSSKPASQRSTSRLPVLVAPEAMKSCVFNKCDEPNFILADLDLDLPGPYMLPATSMEDLQEAGFTSRLPKLKPISSSQSAPNTERLQTNNGSYRKTSTRSDEGLKLSMKLPPLDVDLDTITNLSRFNTNSVSPDIDIDTISLDKPSKQSKSTLARKIASRKAAGLDYTMPKSETLKQVFEHTHYRDDHVHGGCTRNQPTWNSSPLHDGDLDTIPLDWNTSHSNSSMSLRHQRSQSFGDMHRLTAVGFLSTRPNLKQLTQPSSLTNLYHFEAKIQEVDAEFADNQKQFLKKNNSWLDYD